MARENPGWGSERIRGELRKLGISRRRSLGVQTLLSSARAPRANAMAERVIRSLRNECLDRLIILNEQHLLAVFAEFVWYDNTERPHRGLLLNTPRPAVRPAAGSVHSKPVLGCLHHVYERAG